MNRDVIVCELLVEGLDDWVPVDRLIGLAREAAERSRSDFRAVAIEVLTHLVRDGFMIVGELGGGGFEAWPGSADEVLERAVAALDGVHWAPAGGGFWLMNTPKGDRTAAA